MLVSCDTFAEADDFVSLRTGACLAAGYSFKGVCLVEGAPDLTCQEESLLIGGKRLLQFVGLG